MRLRNLTFEAKDLVVSSASPGGGREMGISWLSYSLNHSRSVIQNASETQLSFIPSRREAFSRLLSFFSPDGSSPRAHPREFLHLPVSPQPSESTTLAPRPVAVISPSIPKMIFADQSRRMRV